MIGAPTQSATDAYLAQLEQQRRLVALRVDTLTRAVVDPGDAVGWARLTELGTAATVAGQDAAKQAAADYALATLEAAGAVTDPVAVPVQSGVLASGRDVRGMFGATEGVVAARTAAGMPFGDALAASAQFLVGMASSEPYRIGRDGLLAAGSLDSRFERFRRVAEGGACNFCLMLATRGAVYLSADTAGQSRRYHMHCRCHIELVVGADAIGATKGLSSDWRNAISDPDRMIDAGAMRRPQDLTDDELDRAFVAASRRAGDARTRDLLVAEARARRPAPVDIDTPTPPPAAAAATAPLDEDSVQRLRNADLGAEMKAAWDREDWDAADLLESEVDRRQKWADGWGRSYDEYDDWIPVDALGLDADDLPDFDDIPQPRKTRKAVRSEWEADQELRMYSAENYGGGILPELADEARAKGINLWTLMTGDPRTAYKYANQELLQWWATNGGRNPLWELEAAHGRIDARTLAHRRLTEDKARSLAEELIGKNRREAMARRGAEQARQRRGAAGPRTEADRLAAAQRRYQRLAKAAAQ